MSIEIVFEATVDNVQYSEGVLKPSCNQLPNYIVIEWGDKDDSGKELS